MSDDDLLIGGNGNPRANNINLNIKKEDVKPVSCYRCKCPLFIQAVQFGTVSGILIGEKDDAIVPLANSFICVSCGAELGDTLNKKDETTPNASIDGHLKENVEVGKPEEVKEEVKEEEKSEIEPTADGDVDESNIIKFEK